MVDAVPSKPLDILLVLSKDVPRVQGRCATQLFMMQPIAGTDFCLPKLAGRMTDICSMCDKAASSGMLATHAGKPKPCALQALVTGQDFVPTFRSHMHMYAFALHP